MAKITDPDSLEVAVNATATTEELEIQTGTKTIKLLVNGALDDTAPGKTSGVTAKALYSFLKEEWLAGTAASTLRRFKFPLKMIFEGSFIWVNGWAPFDDQTRDLIRDAGFEEQVANTENACMISLGAIDAPGSDLAYYTQATGFTAATAVYDKTGELNENIDITGLNTFQKSHLRVQGKKFSEYSLLVEQGLSTIGFQAYSFPLTNENDAKIVETDGNVSTLAAYTAMDISYLKGNLFETASAKSYSLEDVVQDGVGRWYFCTSAGAVTAPEAADMSALTLAGSTWEAYFGEELIGSTYYAFNRIVDANTQTNQFAYERMQWSLRQTGDINDDNAGITAGQGGYGIVNGEVAELLAEYVGDTLFMKPGVLLRNFDPNSKNNITHQPVTPAVTTDGLSSVDVPITSSAVSFPFVAAGTFTFSDNYVTQADVDTIYTVYFDYTKIQSAATTIATTASTGTTTTFTDSGNAMVIAAGEYFTVSGMTTTANDGLYLETGGAPTVSSVTAVKQDGVTVIDDVAGPGITMKANPYQSPSAFIVEKDDNTQLDAEITAASISWDFDYTNENAGGRTPDTDAPCTIVAIAKDGAEWIDASFTITKATGINVPVNGGDERNYANPV